MSIVRDLIEEERDLVKSVVGTIDEVDIDATDVRNPVASLSPNFQPMPVGTVITKASTVVPDGYLECDGHAINRVGIYADLYTDIGTLYGVGDGSTTFNLPDFRGEFLRGWDHGAGNDPDVLDRTDFEGTVVGDVVGSKQIDAFEAHTHSAETNSADPHVENGDTYIAGYNGGVTGSTGGNETRPRNVSVMYCIKY